MPPLRPSARRFDRGVPRGRLRQGRGDRVEDRQQDTKLLEGFGRQGGRLAKLLEAMEKITKGLDRFSTAGGLAMGVFQAVKPYDTAAPAAAPAAGA